MTIRKNRKKKRLKSWERVEKKSDKLLSKLHTHTEKKKNSSHCHHKHVKLSFIFCLTTAVINIIFPTIKDGSKTIFTPGVVRSV
jgi:hypothetical protein